MQENLWDKWKEHNENNSKESIYITQIKSIVKNLKMSKFQTGFFIIMGLVTNKQQNYLDY